VGVLDSASQKFVKPSPYGRARSESREPWRLARARVLGEHPRNTLQVQAEAAVTEHASVSSADRGSADLLLDDLDQFVELVALAAGEGDEFLCSLDDGASLGCAGDRDASSASELE